MIPNEESTVAAPQNAHIQRPENAAALAMPKKGSSVEVDLAIHSRVCSSYRIPMLSVASLENHIKPLKSEHRSLGYALYVCFDTNPRLQVTRESRFYAERG